MTYFATRPRYWLTRLYCALSVATGAINTFAEPRSLTAQVIEQTGPLGWYWMLALACLAALALLDVIVNDLMPDGYDLRPVYGRRHMLYAGVAVLLFGVASVTYAAVGWTTLLLVWWLDAAMALTIAFVDLFARHRGGFRV